MEVVLTVITLATAIKDMVELAQKIQASFEKATDNLRNAQILAIEIMEIVYELKEFCDQHHATLDDDKELREAVLKLVAKLKLFHSNIAPLIPDPTSTPRLLNRMKGGLKTWKNAERIDASIRELKDDVKKCQMNFMMMSAARIQVKLNEIHKSTSEDLKAIQQGVLDLLTIPPTPHPPSTSINRRSIIEPLNQTMTAFVQTSLSTSTVTSMWKAPSATEDQIIWDTYLKGQIDFIAKSLSSASALEKYSIDPLGLYTSPLAPMDVISLRQEYCDPESLHCDVVMQSLQIRKTLGNRPTSTSVQEAARRLLDLGVGLHYLGMTDGAMTMGQRAVELFRALTAVGGATYAPFLAHGLKHLAHFHMELGNMDDASSAIQEAANVSRHLQTAETPMNLRVQYSAILTIHAKLVSMKDHELGVKLALESLNYMEQIMNLDSLLAPYSKDPDGLVLVSRSFLKELYRLAPSELAIVEYARALRALSDCLVLDDQLGESLDLKVFALAIVCDLPVRISQRMDHEIGDIIYDIITQPTRWLLETDKLLGYAEDCVQIYRKRVRNNASLYGKTLSKYGRCLCDALWEKANALNKLNRDLDALEVWKEIAEVAQQMMQDQAYYADALYQVSWSFRRLKKHEEAASARTQSVLTYEAINNTTTGSQANGHYDLCVDYQLARRFPEAVEAARKAIDQYRVLAFTEPDKWTRQVGQALSALANSLFSAGEHEAALNEGYESIQLFESLIKSDPGCVKSYVYALRVNIRLAITVNSERKAVKRMDDVIQHMRQLAIDFPEEASLALLEGELDCGHNLDRLNRIQEARKYLEDLIAKWEVEEYPHVDKEAFANLHISALISYAIVLHNQGHTDLALVHIRKGTDIGKPLSATNPVLAGQTVGAMYRHAHLLVELGRYDEALVVAEETLKFNRETKMDNESHLVGTLHVIGLAADHTHAYDRVIEASQEAVDICKSDEFVEYCQTNPRSFCLLSRSLQLLSSGNADSGNIELGLKYGLEAVNDAKALRANSRVASADVEQYYMEANKHLGAMYLANDKIAEARGAFEETRVYVTEKVKERSGQSGSLISILRRLGIIYCSEGKHEEGHAAAQEAKKYLDHLAEVFPGLHKLVHIDMRHELSTPSLQILHRMKDQLACEHQAESIFTGMLSRSQLGRKLQELCK